MSTRVTQLCAQVEEAVALALASAADPVLRDVRVLGVAPLAGAARVQVMVVPDGPEAIALPFDEVIERLERARGYLRSEVALAINRKKTPDLMFRISGETEPRP